MSNDIKVGQTVWLENNSQRYGKGKLPIVEAVVDKVGREYFYAYGRKFSKKTLREYSGPNDSGVYAWCCWLRKEDYDIVQDDNKMMSAINSFFIQYNWRKKLTHEQLKNIYNTITAAQ